MAIGSGTGTARHYREENAGRHVHFDSPSADARTTIHVAYLKICGCDLGEYKTSGRDLYDRRYSDVVLEVSMHMYLKSMERTISPSSTPVN